MRTRAPNRRTSMWTSLVPRLSYGCRHSDGMSFMDYIIKSVNISGRHLTVELLDGRQIRLPLSRFPTLVEAKAKARSSWKLCGAGTGIHWPLLDYDLSVEGLLRGEQEAPGIRRGKKTAKYPAHRSGKAHVLAEESLTFPADTLSPTNVEKAGVSGRSSSLVDTRVIYCGDNLEQLKKLPAACVDLIYIDPPFNSNRNYEVFWGETKEKRAFQDRHASTQAYIDFMRPRCLELARVLKKTGSFYYHCDWHASHYVKVMLDQIFGENNFVNEIVWKRSDAKSDVGQGAKHFGRVHDSIFYYAGSDSGYTFNPKFNPLPQSTIDSWYKHVEEGTGRRYNKADVTGPGGAAKGCPVYEWNGVTRAWRYSKENMERLSKEGRLVYSKTGMTYQKRYLDESKGVSLSSWWDDIDMLRGISSGGERL